MRRTDMFDIGAAELLVIIIVAVLVIGPKDLPVAMRTAGRWIGKVRRVSAHFRSGIDTMVREAELEDMEKKWKAQNEAIMQRSAAAAESKAGEPVMTGPPPVDRPDQSADTVPDEVGPPDPAADDPAPRPSKGKAAMPASPPRDQDRSNGV